MICARCGKESGKAKRCSHCGESPLLGERYRFDRVIGHGSSGITYRATRISDNLAVCVKELLYRRMDSFKDEELFHREASVLKQLDHPSIPDYLDEFSEGEGKTYGLYLVQEFVDGENLREEMEKHRYREEEVLEVLLEMSKILAYLHNLRPPVVHRDIKPSNVMRRKNGRLALVDFGSVKKSLADATVGGTTVAGTFGYMAPEQLYGQAEPASDLYALGMLGLVLLSGRQPEEMLDAERRLAWKRHVSASKETIGILENLLERDPKRRAKKTRRLQKELSDALEALRRPPEPIKKSKGRAPKLPKPGRPKAPAESKPSRAFWWGALPFVIVGGVFAYSYWNKTRWIGDKPLYCGRDAEKTFEEKTVFLRRGVVRATGRCKLTLIRCTIRSLKGSTATLRASGHARVRIVGGRIDGLASAVRTRGDATVILENVQVETRPTATQLGRYRGALHASDRSQIIVRGGSVRDPERAAYIVDHAILAYGDTRFFGELKTNRTASVLKAKPGENPEDLVTARRQFQRQESLARAAKRRGYGASGCAGIRKCYREHAAKGYAVGRLRMWLTAAGYPRRKEVHAPGASPPLLGCLQQLVDNARISKFDERGGLLTCDYSGDPSGPSFRVNPTFRPR